MTFSTEENVKVYAWIGILSFIILSVILDPLSTKLFLQVPGMFEANILGAYLFDKIGFIWSLILMKGFGTLICLLIFNVIYNHRKVLALILLYALTGCYFAIVWGNFLTYLNYI